MPRATLHYGGRSPVDGAWDAKKHYLGVLNSRPGREERISGLSSGDVRSQDTWCASRLTLVLLFLQWLLSYKSDSAKRHKPTEEPANTTDEKPALNSAGRCSPAA